MTQRFKKNIILGFVAFDVTLVLAVAIPIALSARRVTEPGPVVQVDVPLATLPDPVERGAYLYRARACIFCHGSDLSGGHLPATGALGDFYAANLTRGAGGLTPEFSDADLTRAIRYGVRPDGRRLLLMSEACNGFTDDEVAALIAFIRSVPPVDRKHPPQSIRLLAHWLHGVDAFPLIGVHTDGTMQRPLPDPPSGVTAEFGGYLVDRLCRSCHGTNLTGALYPSSNVSADIWNLRVSPNITMHPTEGLGGWTFEEFAISTQLKWFYWFNEDELRAMWLYLQTAPISNAGPTWRLTPNPVEVAEYRLPELYLKRHRGQLNYDSASTP